MKSLRTICFIAFLLLISTMGLGQQTDPYQLWMNPATDDFATIQQTVEQYFEGRDHGRGSGYVQWKRWEYFNKYRLTPDGKITNVAARNWQAYLDYMQKLQTDAPSAPITTFGYWSPLNILGWTNGAGWNPGIGRVNVIAFHPTNSSIFWIGCPSGGLWKTINGGTSWTPLTDGMPRIGVSGIAINPSNTNIMYILTGDGDGADTYSIGVLKTTNGGETWLSTGLSWNATDFKRGYKLAMNPNDVNMLFAVTSDGIYRTTNAGANWTLERSGWFFDLEFKPGDPTYVYACTSTQFWRSTDSGDNWTQITSGVPTGCTRMALGVSPASSGYVYIFAGPPTAVGVFKGVYRSFDSGANFYLKANTPNLLGYSSTGNDNKHQTTYDLAMTVSRTDEANLIVGGINTWKSTDWGSTWTITSMWNDPPPSSIGYTHADIHDLAINPLNNYLYCCSDGGVFRSTDFGDNWTDLSYGLEITQWYCIAGYQAYTSLIIGGTQDNGSNKWSGGGTLLHILGADGMDCMIDHTNSLIMYYSSQDGDLKKSINGGTSYSSIQPAGSTGTWVTPYIMDPVTATTIYGGYDDVYKSINGGTSWTNKGVDGRGAMAIGTNNTDRVYAANGSSIWMSNNGGDSWTPINAGLPGGRSITYIAVNPDFSMDVFVTLDGYSSGEKVYMSNDAGSTWTNISGSLPNVPTNCIAYEDCNGTPAHALYVGTDIGVFYRNTTLGDWIPFRNGLPTVSVKDLIIYKSSNLIRAATYGRGIWSSELYSTCPVWYYLSQGNDPSNPNYTGYQYYESSDSTTSSRIITGGLGTNVTYRSNGYIRLTQGFHAREHNKFKAILGPCGGIPVVPPQKPVSGNFEGPMKD
jgi:photosystem II stability/assembly factor-like uncharacterized protein